MSIKFDVVEAKVIADSITKLGVPRFKDLLKIMNEKRDEVEENEEEIWEAEFFEFLRDVDKGG